jgi:hypothetical protein
MKFFYRKFLAAFVFLCFQNANAELVYSVKNGEWFVAGTWNNNHVPLATDSVVVDHYVIYYDSVFIASAGNLVIDSCGTLCGNYELRGHFYNYGTMLIGSFYIIDSSYSYGTIYSNNTSASGVGSGILIIAGGSVHVGPNMPPCSMPSNRSVGTCQRVLALEDELTSKISFHLFPNPANDEITITTETENEAPFDAYVYDIAGNCVLAHKGITQSRVQLKVNSLPLGYYFLKLTDSNSLLATKGFVIAR